MTDLKDSVARDLITNGTQHNLFVEAGAGSGKTRQLVQRILTLVLEQGEPITTIAAITFTEKAAEELIGRLRALLTEARDTGRIVFPGGEVRTFINSNAQDLAQQALLQLPGAAIETIHSFCLRLISLYPLEAGIPPRVRKTSEMMASVAAAERTDAVLEFLDALAGGKPWAEEKLAAIDHRMNPTQIRGALANLMRFGIQLSHIRNLVEWLDSHWGELDATTRVAIPEKVEVDADFLTRLTVELCQIGAECTKDDDKLKKYLDSYIGEIGALVAQGQPTYIGVSPIKWSPGNRGAKTAWGRAPKEVRDQCKEIYEKWKAQISDAHQHDLGVLRRFLCSAVIDNANDRARTGHIEHHDMIYLARNLLRHREVARELSRQFIYLMVDEFQDTDPAQAEIITALFDADPDTPGRLFTVGDPKQSIYSFRRADINTYLASRPMENAESLETPESSVSGATQLVKLNTNFRSEPEVLKNINLLFKQMFHNLESGEAMPGPSSNPRLVPFDDLHARPDSLPTDGEVICYRDEGSLASEVHPTDLENRSIIDAIYRARQRGFAFEDIAILVTTHKVARRVMETLEVHGVPFMSEGSTLAYQSPDIVDLHTVLRAIADPADAFTETSALRTSILGCSDEDLARHALEGGDGPVKEARSQLVGWRKLAASCDIGELMGAVVDHAKLTARIAGVDLFNVERLNFICDQARQFSTETAADLRAYLRWVDEQASDDSRVADPIIDDDRGGLRLLTMHGSKGREFPVVILAGLSGQWSEKADAQGLSRHNDIVEFKAADLQTSGYDDFSAFVKKASTAELVRLLYVAATRAQRFLAIPLEIKNNKNGSLASARGRALLEAVQELGLEDLLEISVLPEQAITEQRVKLPIDWEALQRNLQTTEAALKKITWVSRSSVTGLVRPRDGGLSEILEIGVAEGWFNTREEDLHDDVGRTFKGAAFGAAVHAVMEKARNLDDIHRLAPAMVGLVDLDGDAVSEVIQVASNLMGADVVQRAFAVEHYKEMPIFGTLRDMLVDGVIDLLYRDGDQWVIADYKTDVSADARKINSYFAQLSLYARLLDTTALGASVSRLELVFSSGDGAKVITRQSVYA